MKNGPYNLMVAPKDYPGFKYRGRYVYEHIAVWWKTHGFVPPKGFEIHHKNMNHRDNRIENLQLLTASEHRRAHVKPRIEISCGQCVKQFKITKAAEAWKRKRNKSGKIYCSRKCQHQSLRKENWQLV